jgi:hypothetical protein
LQDNLSIYDGDTDHHRNIATVCGSATPKIFTTTQDKALVVWHLGKSLQQAAVKSEIFRYSRLDEEGAILLPSKTESIQKRSCGNSSANFSNDN